MSSLWIFLALGFAIASSIGAIIDKHLIRRIPHMVVALGGYVASLPFVAIVLLMTGVPQVDTIFWLSVVATSLLNIGATVLAFQALAWEDASFLAPIAAFNPVITTIISIFTLHEFPSPVGIVGIGCIGIGAVFLGQTKEQKLHVSLAKLFERKSVQYMLICYLIWSVTPTFEKTAILHTSSHSPLVLEFVSSFLVALGIVPFAMKQLDVGVKRAVVRATGRFVLIGVVGLVGQIAAYTAFTMTHVGYATAIFKTSMLFTVLFAGLFLKERGLESRLVATVFMLVGVVLLSLG